MKKYKKPRLKSTEPAATGAVLLGATGWLSCGDLLGCACSTTYPPDNPDPWTYCVNNCPPFC